MGKSENFFFCAKEDFSFLAISLLCYLSSVIFLSQTVFCFAVKRHFLVKQTTNVSSGAGDRLEFLSFAERGSGERIGGRLTEKRNEISVEVRIRH